MQVLKAFKESASDTGGNWGAFGMLTVLGVFCACWFAACVLTANFWLGTGGAAVAAGAPLAVGALLGFLFGIPKSASEPSSDAGGAGATSGSSSSSGQATIKTNTNIEKISDSVTTMLVGIGLSQIRELPAGVSHLADGTSHLLGGGSLAGGLGASMAIFFSIAGFLMGYVLTRTRLSQLFKEVDDKIARTIRAVAAAPITIVAPEQSGAGNKVNVQVDVPPQRAATLLSQDLGVSHDPETLRAWGKAKLKVGDPDSAAKALRQAVALSPDDSILQYELGAALLAAGRTPDAIATLEALSARTADAGLSLKSAEAVVQSSLYEDPPLGFQKAILVGVKSLTKSPGVESARLCGWLARAYGQKHHSESTKPDAQDPAVQSSMQADRADALMYARRAVHLDPTWKAILERARQATGGDLQDFKQDAEFKALLT